MRFDQSEKHIYNVDLINNSTQSEINEISYITTVENLELSQKMTQSLPLKWCEYVQIHIRTILKKYFKHLGLH